MENQRTKKKNKKQASITVEAALAFPIFFFALFVFLYFFQLMLIQAEVRKGLFETASFSAQYAHFTEVFLKDGDSKKESYGYQGTLSEFAEGVLDQSLIKIKFLSAVNREFLEHSCIQNGVMGISLLQSEIMEQGNDIDIIAVYKITIPNPVMNLPSYRMVQHVKTKAFLGKSMMENAENKGTGNEKDKDADIVYIAETGIVYHLSRDCTYLNPSIRQITFKDLEQERNSGGHKYSLCGSCCKEGKLYEQGYITTWGDAFHSRLDCSGLKRTIREEERKEAEEQGYHACSKCR